MKLLFVFSKNYKVDNIIDIADGYSVPEHISSPNIKLFSSQLSIIYFNSDILKVNVLKPLNKSSFDFNLVNILLYG